MSVTADLASVASMVAVEAGTLEGQSIINCSLASAKVVLLEGVRRITHLASTAAPLGQISFLSKGFSRLERIQEQVDGALVKAKGQSAEERIIGRFFSKIRRKASIVAVGAKAAPLIEVLAARGPSLSTVKDGLNRTVQVTCHALKKIKSYALNNSQSTRSRFSLPDLSGLKLPHISLPKLTLPSLPSLPSLPPLPPLPTLPIHEILENPYVQKAVSTTAEIIIEKSVTLATEIAVDEAEGYLMKPLAESAKNLEAKIVSTAQSCYGEETLECAQNVRDIVRYRTSGCRKAYNQGFQILKTGVTNGALKVVDLVKTYAKANSVPPSQPIFDDHYYFEATLY